MIKEPKASEPVFCFTTSGGGLLIQRIVEIEKLGLSNIQGGKSLDHVVTAALVSLRDACNAARVAVG